MKILLFLVLPCLLLAQETSCPDTIVMKNGKTYPCLVSDLDKSAVQLIYGQNPPLKMYLPGVQKLVVAEKGVVFQEDIGLTPDLEAVQNFISLRWEKWQQDQAEVQKRKLLQEEAEKKLEELAAKSKAGEEQIVTEVAESQQQVLKGPEAHRWSFGVWYTPFSSENIYEIYYPYYPYYVDALIDDRMLPYPIPYVKITSNEEPQMEAQLAFRHPSYPHLRLTCDLAYTRSYTREHHEEHTRYTDGSNPYDYGYIETADMKLFRFSIGIKYYFSALSVHKVSPYILAGGGKQFAFVNKKTKDLFVPLTTTIEDDNEEEYLADLNSPVHIFLGFGVEYPFNESLSLFASVRFYYTWASGHYDYRYITDTYTNTQSTDNDVADLVKRVGLGFNFYF
jgi:hypothetical protein